MKLTILALLFSLSAFAQSDTTVQFNFNKKEWLEIVQRLDRLIDSKKETKELFELFDRGFKLIADKPKELKPKQ